MTARRKTESQRGSSKRPKAPPGGTPLCFHATLYRFGILRAVDVPPAVSRALGDPGHVPVRGRIEGLPFRSTLAPRGGGKHRLVVHSRHWRPRGKDAGDDIEVELAPDRDSRDPAVPRELAGALAASAEAKQAFDSLPPSLRKEMAVWIAAARRPETRERRLALTLEHLAARKSRGRKRLDH